MSIIPPVLVFSLHRGNRMDSDVINHQGATVRASSVVGDPDAGENKQ